jgi:hypothetical protein
MNREHPMLMSTVMAESTLADLKTMTRRLTSLDAVNQQPDDWHISSIGNLYVPKCGNKKAKEGFGVVFRRSSDTNLSPELFFCPYGNIGDLIWVRETWQRRSHEAISKGFDEYYYKAGWKGCNDAGWKPSIHMPKAASRIWLKITDIKVERLNSISEDDAIKEGIIEYEDGTFKNYFTQKGLRDQDGVECLLPKGSFQSLWCSINGIESWDHNPWVWVISFQVVSKTGKPADL